MSALLDRLGKARTLLGHSPERALGELLEAWRACRHPDLARVIDRLSAGFGKGDPMFRTTFFWPSHPTDVERGQILRGLKELDDEASTLDSWPDDPRTSATVARLLAAGKAQLGFSEAQLLTMTRDVRVLRTLERVKPRHGVTRSSLEDVRRALSLIVVPALDAEERAELAWLHDHVGNAAAHSDAGERGALLAGVLEHPDDLQRRSVFADWLLEHDDPWGELIALQTRERELVAKGGGLDAGEAARVAELLERHAPEWAGVHWTENWQDRFELEDGFLGALFGLEPGSLAAGAAGPRWATVRRVQVNSDVGDGDFPTALAPFLPSLREAWLPSALVAALGQTKLARQIETIVLDPVLPSDKPRLGAVLGSFPRLAIVGAREGRLGRTWFKDLPKSVEGLRLLPNDAGQSVPPPLGPPWSTLLKAPHPRLGLAQTEYSGCPKWSLDVDRREGWSAVIRSRSFSWIEPLLELLPPRVRSLRIEAHRSPRSLPDARRKLVKAASKRAETVWIAPAFRPT